VEIAIGWHTIAFVHLAGHACFRLLQFLSAPNVLHDLHGISGTGEQPQAGRRLFLFALERGFLDDILDRVVVAPFMLAARAADRMDRWLCDIVMRSPIDGSAPEGIKDE